VEHVDGRVGLAGRVARVGVALALVTLVSIGVAGRSVGEGTCRITGGHAALLVDRPLPDGSMGYEGVIFVVTQDCGTGAKGVSGTFAPVGGTPATCARQYRRLASTRPCAALPAASAWRSPARP
jgi:hypothetical protein